MLSSHVTQVQRSIPAPQYSRPKMKLAQHSFEQRQANLFPPNSNDYGMEEQVRKALKTSKEILSKNVGTSPYDSRFHVEKSIQANQRFVDV